jgi:hypothetical protein
MNNITGTTNKDNTTDLLNLDTKLIELKHFIVDAARSGVAAHKVEKELYRKVFELGLKALQGFFTLQGTGDIGETLEMPDGRIVKRLDELRNRNYRSVFGTLVISRAVYGSGQKSKIECIPLDERLQLPLSEQSHVLQEISQFLCMEMPYNKVKEALERFLPINLTVDTLERITREQSNTVSEYRDLKIPATADEEGELLIITADGKGIPIKSQKSAEEKKIEEHKIKKQGPKPGQKRIAVVGGIYSIDRYIRTPEEILEALFRTTTSANDENVVMRPSPENKELVAHLDQTIDGSELLAAEQTFSYLAERAIERINAEQEVIFLIDGQPSLWEKKKQYFGARTGIEILDLLHVNSYLWDIASLLHPDNKQEQIEFMQNKLLKVLQGQIGRVIGGIKQSATKLHFSKAKQDKLDKLCNYLHKNRKRMRYDLFLANGYPIATGVIEGACRHYIKDRMERAGMKWTMEGAQAMLDMRSIFLNGDWAEFQQFRIQKETEMLYPYREEIFAKIEWPLAA